ncbi:hypothetical protein [Denitromonas halophila]|uniref:Uncharacterized protein n=1 Tax=Denitromonas halophila TaxID=1629404 RepID=A0A557R004_9RHOO|nr:hypothetical protein [Denitromonas halophila]TVO58493.1 hypothetical protein FHP91_02155 [Denitromonas halophila]
MPKRRRIPWVLVGVVLFVLAFMGRTGYDIYDKRQAMARVQAAFAEYDRADRRWARAVDAALKASGEAAAGPVREMTEAEQTVARVPASGCAARVGEQLVLAMQASRQAVMARSATESTEDAAFAVAMRGAKDVRLDYEIARARCFESPRS